jgi:2-hydroxy-4-carboxymuconate semialdehyde hemiacetal dehydrogenase
VSSPIRICLVGYGAIARVHAEILRKEGALLHSVVGRRADETDRFAAEFGFTHSTTDLVAACSRHEVDAVVVASPSALHFAHGRQALLSRKHTLVETPLAMSYAEGAALVDLAHRQGRFLMVAASQRFIPSLSAVRDRVSSGLLHVYHLVGRSCFLRRKNVGWTGRPRTWTDNLLWHHACHLVDFALWFLGVTRAEVHAQLAPPDPRTGIPMDLDIVLHTSAEQLVALSLSYHSQLSFHDYVIICEEQSLHFDRGTLRESGVSGQSSEEATGDYERLAWEAQDREFLAALRGERQPAASGADVLPALAVLQEIQDRFMVRAEDSPKPR